MTSAKVYVNDCPIGYEKFGTGSKILLMIPGGIGTGLSDFYDQLIGEYALDMQKLTIIAVELPGWGRSRPPLRHHGKSIFKDDSKSCIQLMETLGYSRFSVLGWSEGARVSLVMANTYPDHIEDLILLGIIAFPTEINTKNILLTSNVNNWGQHILNNYLRSYEDIKEIQELWRRHMIFISNFPYYFPNGICDNNYNSMKCRTFIIHGDKDPLVQLEQPLHVLSEVKGAQIKRFPMGSHNLHHKYKSEFKRIVEEFLFNND